MNSGRSELSVDENQFITDEVQSISESGLLGRSRAYGRLLDYLARCSIESRRPKEFEIAAEVFDKDGDFDPNQDSLVRVYIHNLRQKLDNYYATTPDVGDFRLEIPKGEYRLAVVSAALAPPGPGRPGMPPVWLAAAVGLLAINLVVLIGTREASPEPTVYEEAQRIPLIIKAPGFASAKRKELVYGLDLTPTIAAMAGLEAPEGWHGRPLSKPGWEHLVTTHGLYTAQRAVSDGDYRAKVFFN